MSERMLVVDDEPDLESLIRQRFRRRIKDGDYNFVFAANGLEALAKILEYKDIGIILSDINMPEMDGLTLLAKLNELKNPALRTVIVSAYGDMDNIRTAMNRGAYDFVTKPVDFIDLEKTIEKTIRELEGIRNSVKEHDQLIAIRRDLETARNIQSAILPKIFPPFPDHKEFDIFAMMEPAKEVGGDFYDFFKIGDDRVGFVIGDVAGKGVPAAIFMAVSRTLLRATAVKGLPPEECLAYVNNLLFMESESSMFVTVFYGILDYTTGQITYANGGHNPPYLLTAAGELLTVPMTGGVALGALPDMPYKNNVLSLQEGDTIFLFTDGVTEAMDAKDELYSEERLEPYLREIVAEPINVMVQKVFETVHTYSREVDQSDDITAVAVRFFKKA